VSLRRLDAARATHNPREERNLVLLPEPMLAKPMARVPTGDDWWMELKYDGWRILSGVLDGVVMWTRGGNLVTQVPYIAKALQERFPQGTILDGEIVDLRTTRQWNRAQSILSKTAGGYQHHPTPDDPPLTYVLFDVLQVGARDVRRLPLSERRALLEEMCDGIENATDGNITLIATQKPTDEGLEALLAFGFEGVVCKRKDSTYRCGARNGGWVKIKPKETVDAECTGIYEPEPGSRYAPIVDGKPRPWAVGGVRFRLRHNDGRVYDGRAAGMNDQLRRELWEQPHEFIGRVIELVHWGIQDSGALRFPQVRRLRSPADKPAQPRSRRLPANVGALEVEAPTAASEQAQAAKPWMRNYGAMGAPKLLDSIASLRERSGEAFQKCVEAEGDVAEHLAAAERAARKKNLL
jgi:bifunctional non-homologous end joining protein LigD